MLLSVIAVLVIVGGIAYYIQYTRDHRSPTKVDGHQYLSNVDKIVTSSGGEVVYDKLKDNGCGRNPTTWLSTEDVCTMSLVKVFKAKGSSEANLRDLQEKIIASEWVGGDWSYEYMITHREGGGRIYSNKTLNYPPINLVFFSHDDPRDMSWDSPEKSFGLDYDIPLTGDEYLYGITISVAYWP